MSDWQQSPPSGPYGGQPHGGAPYGGQPYGGQPYGGAPHGGQPYGGQPGGGYAPPRATFWQRAAALIIDGLVASAAMMVMVIPLVIIGVAGSSLNEEPCAQTASNPDGICTVPTGGTVGLWLLLGMIWFFGYLAIIYFIQIRPVAKSGQTIGRRAMSIRVVDARTGQLISTSRAFGRYLFASFISGVMYIGYLWMLWDDNKQTLHDKVTDAVVVPA